jgi:hypothetical protein
MYPERGRQVLERLTLPVSHRRVGLCETLHERSRRAANPPTLLELDELAVRPIGR